MHKGSGWITDQVDKIYVNIAEKVPLNGGTYLELPKKLKDKKACVNIKNKNNCFEYSTVSELINPEVHLERPEQ